MNLAGVIGSQARPARALVLGFVVLGFVGSGGCTSSPAASEQAAVPVGAKESPAAQVHKGGVTESTAGTSRSAEPKPPSKGNRRTRLTARGYGVVDLSLPRLRHEGGIWRTDGGPVPMSKTGAGGKRVLLEGKMILDDSLPRRRTFWVAPHYDGCVDKHERLHRPHWVEVTLPEGQSVQVSDQPLYIEGVARRAGSERLTFDAVTVQLQAAVIPTDGGR